MVGMDIQNWKMDIAKLVNAIRTGALAMNVMKKLANVIANLELLEEIVLCVSFPNTCSLIEDVNVCVMRIMFEKNSPCYSYIIN